ncbi:MAG: phytanoyl-CoA dioxygenase family protein [Pseudomonadota bacterium]
MNTHIIESELTEDPTAFDKPLDALGWVDKDPNSAEVNALRARLEKDNGIHGLEVVSPQDVERARNIFYRDGFVVVSDALDSEQLGFMRQGCDREIHKIVALDRNRIGNRGSHRYSFGSASRTSHMLHTPEWAMLVDLPNVTPILTAIFDSSDYTVRRAAGDFCLPGATEYQPLHSDMGDASFKDPRGLLTYRDLPCPIVCCNYLMVDFTRINGPTRQIPGTQHSREKMPTLAEEPDWMKLSTVCPAPAGSVLIRDIRAWHGGTPNLSNEVRAIPNTLFYAPWFNEPFGVTGLMPKSMYNTLSAHGKHICRHIVADEGDEPEIGYRQNLGRTPKVFHKKNLSNEQ